MENREKPQIPPELAPKVRLVRTGLYCFVSCLSACIVSFASSVPFDVIGGPVFSAVSSALMTLGGVLFACCFASFGLLFIGLVKKPTKVDVAPYMSDALPGVVVIFTAGGCFFVLVIIGVMAAFVLTLYSETKGLILLSLAYFLFSAAFFFIAHSFILAIGILKKTGTPGWLGRISARLGLEGGDKPVSWEDGKKIIQRGRVLSRMEAVLGAMLGVVVFALTGAADYTGLIGKFLGSEAEEKAEAMFSSTEILLAVISLFIFVFSTMFIMKTIRSIVSSRIELS